MIWWRLEMVDAVGSVNAKIKSVLVEAGPQVRKIRDKIEKNFKKQQSQITPEALKQTIEKIRQKFAINVESGNYETVEGKPLTLFAHNQNAARVSKKVEAHALLIQNMPTAALDALGKPFIKVPDSIESI